MDYLLKSGPVKKERYRIGFLDDNRNNDFHIQIMMGIIEAAKEIDVDVIRFGYYSSHIAYKFTHQVAMVLDNIEQYSLDGLLFLGWTKAGAMYNYNDFISRFDSIPLMSIGTEFDDIPCVFFSGDTYIRDITRHLIEKHKLTRIAFIDHNRPDARADAYRNVMKQYGFYDPRYYIRSADLDGYDTEGRNRRALELLLDDRKLEVQAIISLNLIETGYLLNALEERDIKVPGDIAVTSYEDGEAAKYLSPGLTTVYFPWRELGYNGCKSIAQLLKTGKIPMSSRLNSTIVFRESCGCLPEEVERVPAGEVRLASCDLAEMGESELASITHLLEQSQGNSGMDLSRLVSAFVASCCGREENRFLFELGSQLRRCCDPKNLGYFLPDLRKLFYPYLLREADMLQWAGDLFHQSQVYISESLVSGEGLDMVEANRMDRMLQEVSQTLLVNFSLDNIGASMETGLPKLGIPGCFIFVSDSIFRDAEDEGNLFENGVLAFRYQNGKRERTTGIAASVKGQLSEILDEYRMNISFAYLLHVTDEVMGFVLFEPGPLDESIYQILSTNISTVLRGLVLANRLNRTYNELVEHARREGMADIAADILHNIGNILNSISVSMHLLEEGAKSTVLDDLIRACELLEGNMDRLEEFICTDGRGKKLMTFFLKMGAAAKRLQTQLKYNVERLQSKAGAINETIAAQQNYAGIDTKLEEISVENVLEDALKINQATFEKVGIRIERKYASGFRVRANRAKLFFVIVNIIANAKDAMLETAGPDKILTLSVFTDDSGKYLRIDDTGTGLKEDLLDRIFDYGFTTKIDKSGYGLYNCAAYMTEMGGSVRAESGGPGKGASFILRFV
jgi:DNA-binding LacI/PurR family transcriptional regulator/signal transduction histidine kinase